MNMHWSIRTKNNGQPNYFSFKLHHGGVFKKFPGRRYVNGRVSFIDNLDIDEFLVHKIDWMVKDLDLYKPGVHYFYHFQVPGKDLDFGLVALGNDSDVINLAQYTNLDTYDHLPHSSKVVIEEIDDVVPKPLLIEWVSVDREVSVDKDVNGNKEVSVDKENIADKQGGGSGDVAKDQNFQQFSGDCEGEEYQCGHRHISCRWF
ncbi:hypothetical protein R6Q57_029743 [Mikania cordata]